MSERLYSEEEVAEIFERATEAQTQKGGAFPLQRAGEGMTLAELKAIGRDVGIPDQLVAEAARSLDVRASTPGRKILGLPVGVGQTVELARPLTEEEWHRLVVDLRDTFQARGKMRDEGAFKQWTNGNLEVLLEPTPTGQRLSMRTVRGNSLALMRGGLGMIGMAAAVGLVNLLTAGGLTDPGAISVMALLSTIGGAMFGIGALQLPGWARLRRRQMEGVAERAAALAASEPQELASGD